MRGAQESVLDPSMMPGWLSLAIFSLGFISAIWAIMRHLSLMPSNDRSWVIDNERQAEAEFNGDEVTVRNVRDFEWRSGRDFDERWIDLKLNLTEVEKIWFVLEYFDPKRRQMAHTIISFEMSDGTRLACSIEVRRERGERYHPIKGLFRHCLLYTSDAADED